MNAVVVVVAVDTVVVNAIGFLLSLMLLSLLLTFLFYRARKESSFLVLCKLKLYDRSQYITDLDVFCGAQWHVAQSPPEPERQSARSPTTHCGRTRTEWRHHSGMALCRWVKAYLLAVVLLDVSLSLASKEKIRVSYGGVNFNIIRFDDERTTIYKIRFKVDGETSTYKFNTDGDVTDVKVGDLTYEVGPTSVTDVSSTTNQSHRSTKRALAEDNEETGNGAIDLFMIDRRRLYACGNCEGAWDLMCSQGLQSVCKLVDFGSPFGDSAEVSISTVCDDFGGACSSFNANQACEHQCEDEDDTGQCTVLRQRLPLSAQIFAADGALQLTSYPIIVSLHPMCIAYYYLQAYSTVHRVQLT